VFARLRRANGRELRLHWLSASWQREHLNGAGTAPLGRGCVPLAPLFGENDNPERTAQEYKSKSAQAIINHHAKGAVALFPKSGVQLISRLLEIKRIIVYGR